MTQTFIQWAGLNSEQITSIEAFRAKHRMDFLHAAYESGVIDDSQYVEFLSSTMGIPAVDPSNMCIPQAVLDVVSRDLLEKYSALPFYVQGQNLFLAISEPNDILAVDDIRFMTGLEPIVHVASPSSIAGCLGQTGDHAADFGRLEDALPGMDDDDMEGDAGAFQYHDETSSLEAATQAPVVRMVNLIIMDAIRKQASDIHIESYEKQFRVRLRMDGILRETMRPPVRLKNAIISRLKIMARLNIAERRLPQDGRLKVRTPSGKEVEFRISILPTLFGEKVVMRLLDSSSLCVDLSRLGFEDASLAALQRLVHKPHGMILATGPTGSGKTTTLYSVISELNQEGVNISTAEDPVEFSLPGINQVQVNEGIGLTFAAALRSFLRQDPDILLVGEIRDLETAEIAVKAALTGHLVLSTLHTNDAPGALIRLLNMGVEEFLVASSVSAIVAQRLVRRLCPHCRRQIKPDREMLARLGMTARDMEEMSIYEPVGCSQCNDSGYMGRCGIYEVLEMTPEVQALVLEGRSALEIRKVAFGQGMMTLRHSALFKLKNGVTSVQEVIRMTAGEEGLDSAEISL